jgi:hypothetical protein
MISSDCHVWGGGVLTILELLHEYYCEIREKPGNEVCSEMKMDTERFQQTCAPSGGSERVNVVCM